MKSGEADIHFLYPSTPSEKVAIAILTDEEMFRAKRFRAEADQQRWISFRAQMRVILGKALGMNPADVPLILSAHGKPILPAPHDGLHFNLSHCQDLGLLGLCVDGPIGVDIEALDRSSDLAECENIFCHFDEIAKLPIETNDRSKRLLEIWTAKEAILKALGTGLAHPPDQIQLEFLRSANAATSEIEIIGVSGLKLIRIEHPRLNNHRAVIAAPRSIEQLRIH